MINKNEYPYNLLCEIFVYNSSTTTETIGEEFELPVDVEGTLEYILVTALLERERRYISMRYRSGMTYEQIGKSEHLTKERIRQITIRALRKLRNPQRVRYLTKGIAALITERQEFYLKEEIDELKKLIAGNAPQIAEKISDRERHEKDNTPIIHLDFSVRTYNCLHRGGINTLGELAKLSYMEIMHIRNLGKRSLNEINEKLRRYGYPPKTEVLP